MHVNWKEVKVYVNIFKNQRLTKPLLSWTPFTACLAPSWANHLRDARLVCATAIRSRQQGKLRSVSQDVFLLCLVLLLAATALLPSGAAGMEDCECSESGQELLLVLFHAMRFTSCGGTETHIGWSTKQTTSMDDRNIHVMIYNRKTGSTAHAVKQATRKKWQKWDEDGRFSKISRKQNWVYHRHADKYTRTEWQLEARSMQLWLWCCVMWKSLKCLLCSHLLYS